MKTQERKEEFRRGASFDAMEIQMVVEALDRVPYVADDAARKAHERVRGKFRRMQDSFK